MERPAEPAPEEQALPGRYHRVQAGDTLWSLSERYGIPLEELVEVNGLESPDLLVPGQLLFIPDDDPLGLPPKAPPAAPEPEVASRPPPAGDAVLSWPLDGGVLLRDFDAKGRVPHEGLMLAAPQGTPVYAAGDGVVLYAGDEGTAFGTLVIVEHEGGLITVYGHLDALDVKTGQRVRRGERIGRVGSSGRTESPQLHFQVRSGRTPKDPLSYLPPP